jgi:Zinc carboxypeptidase
MTTALPELDEIRRLASRAADDGRVDVQCVAQVDFAGGSLPLHVFTLGNASSDAAAIGVFGGVHGLERIGAAVAIAFLQSLLQRLRWDAALEGLLDHVRIVVMPLVNPGGMLQRTRANPHGVDLMRNAPVEAEGAVPALLGGQRIGPSLPWYRGPAGAPMQTESAALCAVVERELLGHEFALGVDCHSGFGLRDRLWFPHACTPRPIEHLPEMLALAELMDDNLLHHRYLVEPQSRTYLAHGDLWDHLYLASLRREGSVLLPLTLEMGSWIWVRKNPRQLLSRHGLFNPLIEHRQQRVLRRHLTLLDFMLRAAAGHRRWRPRAGERAAPRERALERWYRETR